MKPIKYELQEKESIVKNYNDIENGYELVEMFSYMPEYIEEIYDGGNKHQLKNANNSIQYYVNEKDKYKYIGTVDYTKAMATKIEYYLTDNGMIGYLINIPRRKKYYISVGAVAIFKKKEVTQ